MLYIITLISTLFVSCSTPQTKRDTELCYAPRYAKGFSIERDRASGATLLHIQNPWQGAENVEFYHEIATPAKRIVALSSSYVAMLDAIGAAERIVGVSGARFISTPSVREAIAQGRVADVGYDSVFDFERVKALGTDLVLLYGIAGEAKIISDKLTELGIPYIYIGDYIESDPLGKAEWVVALGYLCGMEEQGKTFFAGVEERYNALRNRQHCSAYHPRVMLNLPYRDTWFMPPHGSYMVRLIEDAGGEYILKTRDDNQQTRDERRETRENAECKTDAAEREQGVLAHYAEPRGGKACEAGLMQNAKLDKANGQKLMAKSQNSSMPISLEEALLLASKADFWINLGQVASKEELCATVPRFAGVDAVKFGRLYNNTKRTTESGGSDFWESGAVRPDLILRDLVKILHYEAPTDSLYYYKKME